jgi:hypothetical protein
MGKMVGNLFLLLFCVLFHDVLYADISLRILNRDRLPLKETAAGDPFLVEVAISNVSTTAQRPEIIGSDQFIVRNLGISFSGTNIAKYRYEVRIDTPGSYTIGPAKYNEQYSNTERIIVGTKQVIESNNTKQQYPVLLRLTADKERVVVGEPVHCRLRFYMKDSSISFAQFIEPEGVKEMRRQEPKKLHKGMECLDGNDYPYLELEWDIFPQKVGNYVIPAYAADYDQEIERENLWGGVGRFILNYTERKRIYSNAVSLMVDPLPVTDKPMQAIGEFSAITMYAKPAVAKQGEGIVVTIDIIGNGDFDSIKFLDLQGMPEALRYYESKQSVIEPTKEGDAPRKRYEFIVQGLKAGSWEIPTQSLYYFDTKRRKYMTLQTAPLAITIMPNAKKTKPLKNQHEVNNNTTEEIDTIAPLHKELALYPVDEFKIPWWLFFGLVLLPLLFSCYQFGSYIFLKKQQESYPLKRAKKAFSVATKQLEIIKKENNVQELYRLFVTLFADRWQESVASISTSLIDQRLKNVGIEGEELASWNAFFSRIAECAFGVRKSDDNKDLFEKAEQWIQRLEKLL